MPVFQTPYGKIGALICWENYMPLARAAMYAQGVQIYIAPTADAREIWQSTIRDIAMEGRCFLLSANQFVTKDMYPQDLGPLGEYIAEPVWGKEEIIIGDLDMKQIAYSQFDFDPVGHYSRPDVFKLEVNSEKQVNTVWNN